MKKIILPALILFSSLLCSAQENSKAKTFLDGVSQQTKSYSTIEISFTFTIQNTVKKTKDTKTGSAIMKGEKYWMEYT